MDPKDEERIVDPDKLPLPEELDREGDDDVDDPSKTARPASAAEGDALDDKAHGRSLTSDEMPDGLGEIDQMARAAGLPKDKGQPIDEIVEAVEHRDDKRWELDPRSSEDYPERANGK